METNRIFRGFCINRFGIGPLNYISSRSDFGFEFSEIFVLEKRLPDSTIRGVGATLRINDTRSWRLSDSAIRGVDDSPHHWYAESTTPASPIQRVGYWIFKKKIRCIRDTESRRLRVSVMRRVVDYGELPTPRIVESGSRVSVIRGVASWKKISLASIFSTLNSWSMSLKD